MARIGRFIKQGDGYVGEIVTLGVQSDNVAIMPLPASSSVSGGAFRVIVGVAEIGSARTSAERNIELIVDLDDPSFVAPIQARLVKGNDGGYDLIWRR